MNKAVMVFLSIPLGVFAFSPPSWAIEDMPRGNVFFTDAAKDAIDNNFVEVSERIDGIDVSLGTGSVTLAPDLLGDETDAAPTVAAVNVGLGTKQDTLTDPVELADTSGWDKDASDDFDGAYSSLTGQPAIPSSASDIGLGNVDNTSDLDKPISTATASALAGKQDVVTEFPVPAIWNTLLQLDTVAAIQNALSVYSEAEVDALIANIDPSADTTPTGFGSVFTADTGVAVSTLSTAAETYTVAGVDPNTAITITGTGTDPQYQINAEAWTGAAGLVSNGDVIGARQTSSASNSTTTTAVVTIGDTTDTYSVTTVAGGSGTTYDHSTVNTGSFAMYDTRGLASGFTPSVSGSMTAAIISLNGSGVEAGDTLADRTLTYRVGNSTDLSTLGANVKEYTHVFTAADTGEITLDMSADPLSVASGTQYHIAWEWANSDYNDLLDFAVDNAATGGTYRLNDPNTWDFSNAGLLDTGQNVYLRYTVTP